MIALDLDKYKPYLTYYPSEGEPEYDGIHDGDIKGVTKDCPEDMRKEFYEFMKDYEESKKVGILL